MHIAACRIEKLKYMHNLPCHFPCRSSRWTLIVSDIVMQRKMLFSNLLLILGLGKPAYGSVAPPPIPTTCPIGKICPWGWGEIYTIYENQPNLTVQRQYNDGIYFEASQKVDRCRDKDKSSSKIQPFPPLPAFPPTHLFQFHIYHFKNLTNRWDGMERV